LTSEILKRMPNLTDLDIRYEQDIDDNDLAIIKNIKCLGFGKVPLVSDRGISQLHELIKLKLFGNKYFTNKALIGLKLTILDLGACENITEEALKHMDIHILCLGHNQNITDDLILKMKNLEILYIDKNKRVTNKILQKKYKILSRGTNKNITDEALRGANIEILYDSSKIRRNDIYLSDYETAIFNNDHTI